MSCARWRDLLRAESVDELAGSRREEYLIHLQGCPSCRRAAAEADPTVVFSLLPEEKIEEGEIEEIRRTVQAMRRVRAMEASWSRRGLAVGALAAMVLMAIVLIPMRSERQTPEEVPFAGAVGVGSGLVNVPRAAIDGAVVKLQVELARSTRVSDLSRSPTLHTVSHLEIATHAGERVDRDLGHGYRIRFSWPGEISMGGPVLRSFQLLHSDQQGEVALFSAHLQPLPNSPLIVGVTPADEDEEQLSLLLTYAADESVARLSEN